MMDATRSRTRANPQSRTDLVLDGTKHHFSGSSIIGSEGVVKHLTLSDPNNLDTTLSA